MQVRDPLDQHQKIRHLSRLRRDLRKSAGKSSPAEPWRKAKENDKKREKEKRREISLLLHLSSRLPGPKLWTSHGSSDAPSKRGDAPRCVMFLFIPPSAVKVGGAWRWKKSQRKSASPTADGRDFPLKVTGGNECTFREMQQRISDADVRPSIVQP